MSPARLVWRRALLMVALAVAVIALLRSPAVLSAFGGALVAVERVAARHEGWAAALVVLCAAGAAILAFFSSWLVVPFAVYTWGAPRALALLLTGWVLGATASYALARRFGHPAARWLGLEPLLARYEELVSHRTPFPLALLLLFALPAEVRGPLFGLGRYRFGRFLAAVVITDLPYAAVTVYAGAAVIDGRLGLLVAAASAFVAASGLAWYALQRQMHSGAAEL